VENIVLFHAPVSFPAYFFVYNIYFLMSLISLGSNWIRLDIWIFQFIWYKCGSFWNIDGVLIRLTNCQHQIKFILGYLHNLTDISENCVVRMTSESIIRHPKVSYDIRKCRTTSESVIQHPKVSYNKK
jgi:hypothetical protein